MHVCKYKTTGIQGRTLGIQQVQVFLKYTVVLCVAYAVYGWCVGCFIKGAEYKYKKTTGGYKGKHLGYNDYTFFLNTLWCGACCVWCYGCLGCMGGKYN